MRRGSGTYVYTQEFDERYRRIVEEINALKEEQEEAGIKKKLAENYEQRVKDMDAFLSGNSDQILEFDNDLVRRPVVSIKVISADRGRIMGYFFDGKSDAEVKKPVYIRGGLVISECLYRVS